LKAEGAVSVFVELERGVGEFPRVLEHRLGSDVTVWCSNDYLGTGQHPGVLTVMQQAIRDSGAAGGTRNITGATRQSALLEAALANLHGTGVALVFTSGYVANEAALATNHPSLEIRTDIITRSISNDRGIFHPFNNFCTGFGGLC